MTATIKYWYLLLGLIFLTSGCTQQHEVTVENQSSTWSKEFQSSSLPFSGSQIKVEIIGYIDGKAHISIFPSVESNKSLKSMSVGPGKFVFSFQGVRALGQIMFSRISARVRGHWFI